MLTPAVPPIGKIDGRACHGALGIGCKNLAEAHCPGCGLPLCAGCLARHAQFPTQGIREKKVSRDNGRK